MKVQQDKQAERLFRDFCEGYKTRDLAKLLSLFASTINLWGSGLDEYRVGLSQVEEQLKRDWSQSEASEIEIVSFVPASKDALWAAAVCKAIITINGQQQVFEHLRGTITVAKENDIYKISHMHVSFPDYRNVDGHSFPDIN